MNQRYLELFKIRVDAFISEYSRATDVFKDLNKQNGLVHAGEYGTFREAAVAKFLRFIIPQKYSITNGFLINSDNQTSSQCDAIVFDNMETPLVEIDSITRFFPVESVLCIGETKSDLDSSSLAEALIKMAENKKMLHGTSEKKSSNATYDEKDYRNNLVSFLICNRIKSFEQIKNFKDN